MIDSLEQLRLPDIVIPDTNKFPSIVEEENGWFVRGPISGSWIGKASSLPGNHTLHVALTIQYVKGLSGEKNKIILERFHFDRFGVKKDSTRRALERLQEAGLIKYTKDGQKYRVTILSVQNNVTQNMGEQL